MPSKKSHLRRRILFSHQQKIFLQSWDRKNIRDTLLREKQKENHQEFPAPVLPAVRFTVVTRLAR